MGAWGKMLWEHMRKLRQRDVRIKGIMQAAVAVGEVVVIDMELAAAGLDVGLNRPGYDAGDKWRARVDLPGKQDRVADHLAETSDGGAVFDLDDPHGGIPEA
jgi:hypothetical protein